LLSPGQLTHAAPYDPEAQFMNTPAFLLAFSLALIVGIDAYRIGARRGLVKGVANMGPVSWFLGSLLVGIFTLPLYLIKRSEIKTAAIAFGYRNG
jgi:hypothetical protein